MILIQSIQCTGCLSQVQLSERTILKRMSSRYVGICIAELVLHLSKPNQIKIDFGLANMSHCFTRLKIIAIHIHHEKTTDKTPNPCMSPIVYPIAPCEINLKTILISLSLFMSISLPASIILNNYKLIWL